jgi:hypothetical protein
MPLHETGRLIEFLRRLDRYPDDAVLYRPREGDVLTGVLHLVDAKSANREVREGAFLVPRPLKGLGMQSWLSVGTLRQIVAGCDVAGMRDEQLLALFVVMPD